MRYLICLAAAVILSLGVAAAAEEKTEQKTLEKELAKKLTGATMAGQFSIDGREETKKPHTDRYEIEMPRFAGNRWVITARIKYGQHEDVLK